MLRMKLSLYEALDMNGKKFKEPMTGYTKLSEQV